MHRATWVYVIVATVAVAGLWLILTIGGRLVPPRDFAGVWSLKAARVGCADVGSSMKLEQSGRFLQLQFSSGLLLKLRMTDTTPQTSKRPAAVPLAGGGVTATISPEDANNDSALLTLSGSTGGSWTAIRQTRTFAGEDTKTLPGTAPAQRSGD